MKPAAAMIAMVLLALPSAANACSICMGDPNSKSAGALNAAIFLMLGFLGAIFGTLGFFAFHLSRRSAAPAPPHAALGEPINDTDDLS